MHITASYNGTDGKMYFDGTLRQSMKKTQVQNETTRSNCYLGTDETLTDQMKFSISDLRFYNSVLEDCEIEYLAGKTSTMTTSTTTTTATTTTTTTTTTMCPSDVTSGLLHQYLFNNSMTDTISANNLVGSASYEAGRLGSQCLQMTGNNSLSFPPGIYFYNSFTVSFWLKPNSNTLNEAIIDCSNGGYTDRVSVGIKNNNQATVDMYTG